MEKIDLVSAYPLEIMWHALTTSLEFSAPFEKH